jgi:hypothetical protein
MFAGDFKVLGQKWGKNERIGLTIKGQFMLEVNEEKLTVIRKYLHSEFPGFNFMESYDIDRGALKFTINKGDILHIVEVSEFFLEDYDVRTIASHFKNWKVAEHLRDIGDTPIMVGSEGLEWLK